MVFCFTQVKLPTVPHIDLQTFMFICIELTNPITNDVDPKDFRTKICHAYFNP